MNYGLYLSATGVLTNSFRQDVIANNLANAQTVGFKRSLALFQQRRTEAQQLGDMQMSNPLLEGIGGGTLLAPTFVDHSQGTLEQTQSNLDVAINGRGYFAVRQGKDTLLTRNGRFMVDRDGYLTLADGTGHRVLDADRNTIPLGGVPQSHITIGPDGSISVQGNLVARLAMLDVPDDMLLNQRGQTLLSYPDLKKLVPATGTLQSGFIEESNVDPMAELTQLINTQRQLEANANMIRYQDQTLGKLVNEVGKIG
jgi:flagellar basal-body rod protein FlgG